MQILLIHQYFLEKDDGGGSRFNEFTKYWSSANNNITVLAGMVHYAFGNKRSKYKGKFVVREEYTPNIEIFRCHVSGNYNKSFSGRLWSYFSFIISGVYAGLFKADKKYDLIVATSPPLFIGIIAVVLSFFKRIPFVFEIRDLWPESAIDTGVLTNRFLIKLSFWFEKYVYRKASLINVLTPAFKEKLIKEKHVNESKIIYIPNAADFNMSDECLDNFNRTAFRKELGLNRDTIIIYVGAHGVANALLQIIETADLLKDEHISFLLVGDGMEKTMLKDEVKRRKLNNVRFIDPVSKKEIFKYILASDIGASVLKKADTFKTVYSNKTFDYMSCKKPVLMAIDGVSRKLVEDAECGCFVEPENPKDFADKIKFYIVNPDILKQHGESGYEFAKQNFDRRILADKYLLHLEGLIK